MPPAPTITIFGATGFIGRAVLRNMIKTQLPPGSTVRIASRNPKKPARPMPLPPNTHHIPCDITSPASVTAATKGSTHVVNLVGILHQTPGTPSTFAKVQAQAPGYIAQSAASADVRTCVHVSAIGADIHSQSLYARSKAEGEAAISQLTVHKKDAHVTILRPSIVYGPEDAFFNRFDQMARFLPTLPLIGGGHTRFQPVHVDDVAQAIVTSLRLPDSAIDTQTASTTTNDNNDATRRCHTFELGGESVLTFKQLMQLLLRVTGRTRFLMPLPYPVANLQGKLFETVHRIVPALPPLLTRDQVTLLKRDNVVTPGAKTLSDLGITPRPCNESTVSYLRR